MAFLSPKISARRQQRRQQIAEQINRGRVKKKLTLTEQFQEAQEKANLANLQRYEQGLGIYGQLETQFQPGTAYSPTFQTSQDLLSRNIESFQPGGTYGQAQLGQFDVGARQARSSAYQQAVGSGLANITGSFDVQARKDRGLFSRSIQDERTKLLSGARTTQATSLSAYDLQRRQALERTLTGKAGFIERREDIGPDPELVARLSSQRASAYVPRYSYI